MRLPIIAALFVSLARCAEQNVACPSSALPAIRVHVRDSITGANAAPGAKLTVVSGTYTDSMLAPSGLTSDELFAGYRAGVYTVRVSKPGYQTWVKLDVNVPPGCDASAPEMTALLQP